jgi:methyltransferase
MAFFVFFLSFVMLQRVTELVLAKKNEKILRSMGAKETDKAGYKVIVVMHILFFVSLIGEKIIFNCQLHESWILLLILFLLTQVLRYWAITSLGVFWNTKILVIPEHTRIKAGPYKYLDHPNYLAVAVEILVIPLIFSCYITSIVFSIVNFFVLRRRITIETEALRKAHTRKTLPISPL